MTVQYRHNINYVFTLSQLKGDHKDTQEHITAEETKKQPQVHMARDRKTNNSKVEAGGSIGYKLKNFFK